jgi:hypothetical protein
MTSPDDASTDSPGDDGASGPHGPVGPDLPVDFDEDAAWRLIVDNYGERARLDTAPTDPPDHRLPDHGLPDRPVDAPPPVPEPPPVTRERRAPLVSGPPPQGLVGAGRHADEHFVPPEPPPLPQATPARRLAWIGLFATPLLMILAVVFGWTFPTWLSLGMVAAFIGGFVFLIATMPRDRGDDWDDGAVV